MLVASTKQCLLFNFFFMNYEKMRFNLWIIPTRTKEKRQKAMRWFSFILCLFFLKRNHVISSFTNKTVLFYTLLLFCLVFFFVS